MDHDQKQQIAPGKGFFAALDQSGRSTPKALKQYGIEENQYPHEAQMFDLVHQMRTRIITSPAGTAPLTYSQLVANPSHKAVKPPGVHGPRSRPASLAQPPQDRPWRAATSLD